LVEKYYNTPYSVIELPENFVKLIDSPKWNEDDEKILFMPSANEFICVDP